MRRRMSSSDVVRRPNPAGWRTADRDHDHDATAGEQAFVTMSRR
jgi:hypothetical protein